MAKDDAKDPGLSNPFSTGGGGHEYEQRVAAHYLASLLAGDIPRGLDRGVAARVALQVRWEGACVDDIKVTSSDDEFEYRLFLQVKHGLTFGARDETFAQVLKECWETLASAGFCEQRDRVGIVVNAISQTARNHLVPLAEWARTSLDAPEFVAKAEREGFSSGKKRAYLNSLRSLLGKAQALAGPEVAADAEPTVDAEPAVDTDGDDEAGQAQVGDGDAQDPAAPPPLASNQDLWRLLRVVVILDFDFGHAGSRDASWTWNRLLDQLTQRDPSAATALADTLFSTSAAAAKAAGSFDLVSLRAALGGVGLAPASTHAAELRSLREHADDVLGAIRDTIGEGVRLARVALLTGLRKRVEDSDVVVILGEPMVGKSALVKRFAEQLRAQGECFTFAVDRFEGKSLSAFLRSFGVGTRFGELLGAAGSAPLRCVICDGVDRAADDDRRRIVSELVTAISAHNKQLEERGVDRSFWWRLLLTARAEDARHLLGTIPALGRNVATFTVEPLTSEELGVVAAQLPFLVPALNAPHLHPVLAKPFVLDVLTTPDVTRDFDPAGVPLTEGRLSRWWWQHVVRLGERRGTGRGHPDAREAIVLSFAQQSLERSPLRPTEVADREALDGLASDRVLVHDGPRWRFGHDAIEDWALSMLLEGAEDLAANLAEHAVDYRLDRAMALLSERVLESGDADGWLAMLTCLSAPSSGSPRWREACLTALAGSARANEFLSLLCEELLRSPGALLSDLARVVKQRCVRPSEQLETLLGPQARAAMAQYVAYWTDPVAASWTPLLAFLVEHQDRLSEDALAAVGPLARTWMTKRAGDAQLRSDLAKACVAWLDAHGLWGHYEKTPRNELIEAVLWAADVLPETVQELLERHAMRPRLERSRGVEEVLLGMGWMPLVKDLPGAARSALTWVLCRPLENARGFGSLNDLGIRHVYDWRSPSPETGPFLALLQLAPAEGLGLVKDVVRHATRAWRLGEEHNRSARRTPTSQEVGFGERAEVVWGTDRVYCWHRHPSCAPSEVTSALMALEAWLTQQIRAAEDPAALFADVVLGSESVAMVGVCVSVALAEPLCCLLAVLPFLEVPAFWLMDTYRQEQDFRATAGIDLLSTFLPRSADRRTRQLAEQAHRREHVSMFASWIILEGGAEAKALCDALGGFPECVPVYFEDEREDAAVIEARRRQCLEWARLADPDNYVREDLGDGRVAVGVRPTHEAAALGAQAEAQLAVFGLQMWADQLLRDRVRGERFTPAAAFAAAQQLAEGLPDEEEPLTLEDQAAQRIMAVALVAAALVVREAEWAKAQEGCVAWCRQQLLGAATRRGLIGGSGRPLMPREQFSLGYRRSAARGLPACLDMDRSDAEVREGIQKLAFHPSVEVRAFLLSALRSIWPSDPAIGWQCLDGTLFCAHAAAAHGREARTPPPPDAEPPSGERGTLARLSTYIARRLGFKRSKDLGPPKRTTLPEGADGLKTLAASEDTTFAPDILVPAIAVVSASLYEAEGEHRNGVLLAADSLLAYTINCYRRHRRRSRSEYSDHNEWEGYIEWNLPLFQGLAELLLVVPATEVEPLLERVREAWPQEPDILEQLLSYLVLPGTTPDHEQRFVELWNDFAQQVLSALEQGDGTRARPSDDLLRVLIFDIVGISWTDDEQLTTEAFAAWLPRWIVLCGAIPESFGALVRLVCGPSRQVLLTVGLVWLQACLGRANNPVELLQRSRAGALLARALRRAWQADPSAVQADRDVLRRFVALTDQLAAAGERLAIMLQEDLAQADARRDL